jgi:soluble lytic murein transglycosylase-like protein
MSINYRSTIIDAANRYGVPTDLALAVAQAESSYNPSAVSSKGAIGLFQLMPATARELGVDPRIPEQNIDGGVRYLKQMYNRFGDWTLALAAYNAGPGNVAKYNNTVPPFGETKSYVAKILESLGLWSGENGEYPIVTVQQGGQWRLTRRVHPPMNPTSTAA